MERSVRKPDFFIVGAPKCGTTAMQDYLSQHPEIYMPEAKELHFFGSDLQISRQRPTEEGYFSYFRDAKDEKRIGEATVWYLYSKRAAYEIKEFNPSSKIIIMLRNPVEMLQSYHAQLLYNGDEDVEDFKTALSLEEERKRGLCLPKNDVVLVERLFYRDIARYHEQVCRYFNAFGRANVNVILFDDFATEIDKVYGETLRFLRLNDNFRPSFDIINPNKHIRSRLIRGILRNPPRINQQLAKVVVSQRLRQGLIKILRGLNTSYEPRTPIDQELKKGLQAEFASNIEALSGLLGRDLTQWTN